MLYSFFSYDFIYDKYDIQLFKMVRRYSIIENLRLLLISLSGPYWYRSEGTTRGISKARSSTGDMSPTCGTITTAPSLAQRNRGSLFEKSPRDLYLVWKMKAIGR